MAVLFENRSRTNLSGTNLSGTNLSGTNLSGTNLSGTNRILFSVTTKESRRSRHCLDMDQSISLTVTSPSRPVSVSERS
ncbi:MAG: pentapeptide repeat-containing protein [Rubripirellula sp.]|nr:pentapeptide repeat-containing protein [Rubripirellula sp.]